MEALGYAVLGSMLSGQKLETITHEGTLNYSTSNGSSALVFTLSHKPAVIYAISTAQFLTPNQFVVTYINGAWTTRATWDGNVNIQYTAYNPQGSSNGPVRTALILIG